MKKELWNQLGADSFVPDGTDPLAKAMERVTHLGIAAHQDDIEILAYHGIAECFQQSHQWFGSVVVTDGKGSPRQGDYQESSDEAIREIRRLEQRKAAYVGEYAFQVQLDYPSDGVKAGLREAVVEDLVKIFQQTRPQVVYLHNPADKHDTHVAVLHRCWEAIRLLPYEQRPIRAYGCEVWRDLDWMVEEDSIKLVADERPHLAQALLGVFDSQIAGGKRYDLATMGRRQAQATYREAHTTDGSHGVTLAMDLTPLLHEDSLSLEEWTARYMARFQQEVLDRLKRFQ